MWNISILKRCNKTSVKVQNTAINPLKGVNLHTSTYLKIMYLVQDDLTVL